MQPFALIAVAAIGVTITCTATAAEPKLPQGAKILDPDVIQYVHPTPTISPDGQWVAYVSKGSVCMCNVNDPAPRRLFEVPDSWTHFLAQPDYAYARGDSGALFRALGKDEYYKRTSVIINNIHSLHWTYKSEGIVFCIQSYDRETKRPTYNTRYVSIDGVITTLSHAGPGDLTRSMGDGILTRDRKYLVGQSYPRPLIWDVTTNKPLATCYLFLTPSPSSGRWIGIEKDSRQLVVTDEKIEIIKRFDEYRPAVSYGFSLEWSPDERFIIWRNAIGFDHFSNWEGFWMNLETGEKRKLEGRFMDEQFGFTGRSGEFYRCGQTGMETRGYDAVVGAHLTLIPDGNGPESDIWRIKVDQNGRPPGMLTNRPGNPPLRTSLDGSLFAIGIPRPAGELSGGVWHLINRDGKKWRFPGAENGKYISPYDVAGFASNGKKIVAYDSTRLFALPVSTVVDVANEAK